MVSTVSPPSTSSSINSTGSVKRLILSDEVWSFIFYAIFGVSRRSIKDSCSLKDKCLSLIISLRQRSPLGNFLGNIGPAELYIPFVMIALNVSDLKEI